LPRVAAALKPRARAVLEGFIAWLDRFGETSHDPHDFWAIPAGRRAKALYYRNRFAGTVATAPFVFLDSFVPSSRSFLRPRARYPIADAHYALGFFAWARASGERRWDERGIGFLDALESSRSPGFDEYCWGYPFDWQTAVGLFESGRPLMTTIPYAYEAFEAGHRATEDEAYVDVMRSIASFVFERIPSVEVGPGTSASAYTPYDRRRVVNASAYRGYLLVAAGERFEREDWRRAGRENLAFVVESQRPDGSWLYALDGFDAFVDNLHTCLVLKNLLKAWKTTGEEDVLGAFLRGYAYYRKFLLDERGQPTAFAEKQRLVLVRRDLYDYAEGIGLALLAREVEDAADDVLADLLQGLLDDWVLPDGHFATRRLVVGWNRVPYHRWAQAQTFYALARYCELED
jgi:hypothetical protein